ncbi:MAG TPA: hypothetical protein VF053_19005 [Streptosporangiales bacterium]
MEYYRDVHDRLSAGDVVLARGDGDEPETLGMIVEPGPSQGAGGAHPLVATTAGAVRGLAEVCGERGLVEIQVVTPTPAAGTTPGSGARQPTLVRMTCNVHGLPEICKLCNP